MRDARFTVDGMDPHNIAAQPVATNAAYRASVIDNERRWNDGTRIPPPLGRHLHGQKEKMRDAKRSAHGGAVGVHKGSKRTFMVSTSVQEQ